MFLDVSYKYELSTDIAPVEVLIKMCYRYYKINNVLTEPLKSFVNLKEL